MTNTLSEANKARTSRDVADIVLEAISEAKGNNLSLIDVSKLFDLADYFVIVSGRSDRQVQGISNKVLDSLNKAGITANSIEGMEEGKWVLIDLGEVVVHVFYEATREYYDFDSLWARGKQMNTSRRAA